MKTTEIITSANGLREEVEVQRLDAAAELEARQDAVWERYGADVSDNDFDFHMAACLVFYRDNYDAGTSEYTVDDTAGGYAIGWKPVQKGE